MSFAQVCAQDLLLNPSYSLEGPEDQLVLVTIRYFGEDEVQKLVSSRVAIEPKSAIKPLAFGHSGIEVSLTSPTRVPVTLKLWDGETLLASRSTSKRETIRVAVGSAIAQTPLAAPRIELSAPEKSFAKEFIAAIEAGKTTELVSDSPLANIDGPTLDAYCHALSGSLGKVMPSSRTLDGWLSWKGSLGVRVIAGPIRFEGGVAQTKLMAVDNRLVDFIVRAPQMPEEWFAGPADETMYIAKARKLVEAMFAGDIGAAHALFATRYHEEVTVDVLQQLSKDLSKNYGRQFGSIDFKTTQLGPYDYDAETRMLRVVHAITLNAKRCLCSVDFVFPCGRDEVAKGNLASINVVEAWQSSRPALAEHALKIINLFALGGDFADFEPWLDPSAKAAINVEEFNDLSSTISAQTGALARKPDWDKWRANAAGEKVFAEGKVEFENGWFDVHLDFVGDRLLGGSITNDTAAFTTMTLVKSREAYSQVGLEFWEALLSNNAVVAHQKLNEKFQQQLPLPNFQQLVDQSELAQPQAEVKIEPAGIKLADRLDRPFPVLVTAFYISERAEGRKQILRCDILSSPANAGQGLNRSSGTEFSIVDFSSDFEALFPVNAMEPLPKLLTALAGGVADDVIALLGKEDQDAVQREVLNGFLAELAPLLAGFSAPTRCRQLHAYFEGRRTERVSCVLELPQGDTRFAAEFEFGKLRSFNIHLDELADFAKHIDTEKVFKDSAVRFVEAWFRELPSQASLLIPDLQNAETGRRLARLRSKLIGLDGEYTGVEILEIKPAADALAAQVIAQIDCGEAGAHRVLLDLEIDAFAGRIAGIEIL